MNNTVIVEPPAKEITFADIVPKEWPTEEATGKAIKILIPKNRIGYDDNMS